MSATVLTVADFLWVINFSTYRIKEDIAEYDRYISSKQNIIDLQVEYSIKEGEINESLKHLKQNYSVFLLDDFCWIFL